MKEKNNDMASSILKCCIEQEINDSDSTLKLLYKTYDFHSNRLKELKEEQPFFLFKKKVEEHNKKIEEEEKILEKTKERINEEMKIMLKLSEK